MLVDLHCHSDQSDGSLTPEELVDHAAGLGLSVLALTDHDTTAGHRRFRARAAEVGLRPVCGVEISCTWDDGNCHLVGLDVPDHDGPLEAALLEIRGGRHRRNEKIIARLNELGYPVTLDEVSALAGGDVVARPHMARTLAAKGLVPSYQEAFDDLLGKGGPAYVDRFRLGPEDAVALVVQAGGKPILAHPGQLKLDAQGVRDLAARLKDHGLYGLEVYYTGVTDERLAAYGAIADELGLHRGGGSDFHGAAKPHVVLGCYGPGKLIPTEVASDYM
jgi:predicted metal-dependent phosphoesterase TrpH